MRALSILIVLLLSTTTYGADDDCLTIKKTTGKPSKTYDRIEGITRHEVKLSVDTSDYRFWFGKYPYQKQPRMRISASAIRVVADDGKENFVLALVLVTSSYSDDCLTTNSKTLLLDGTTRISVKNYGGAETAGNAFYRNVYRITLTRKQLLSIKEKIEFKIADGFFPVEVKGRALQAMQDLLKT